MTKERRLGRGLEALLGRPPEGAADAPEPAARAVAPRAAAPEGGLIRLNVYEIDSNPFQPRQHFDDADLTSLADSIKEHGLLQPLVVRRAGDRYQLVAGERRLRAATKAGWSTVPAQLTEADDRRMSEMAIVENLQRRDLTALEKAASFQQYIERYQVTQDDLAKRLKIDRSTIANLIRLLELPRAVHDMLSKGAISPGHARALLPLGDEREQLAFAQRVKEQGLSVRQIEQMVQDHIHHTDADPLSPTATPAAAGSRRGKNEHHSSLEQELRATLGTKVELRETARGRGRIVIHFSNHEEFERLRKQLSGQKHRDRAQAG